MVVGQQEMNIALVLPDMCRALGLVQLRVETSVIQALAQLQGRPGPTIASGVGRATNTKN
jgi:hypothetical protein